MIENYIFHLNSTHMFTHLLDHKNVKIIKGVKKYEVKGNKEIKDHILLFLGHLFWGKKIGKFALLQSQ